MDQTTTVRPVVTWQTPGGYDSLTLCKQHEQTVLPVAACHGEPYCQVSHGSRRGECDVCAGWRTATGGWADDDIYAEMSDAP